MRILLSAVVIWSLCCGLARADFLQFTNRSPLDSNDEQSIFCTATRFSIRVNFDDDGGFDETIDVIISRAPETWFRTLELDDVQAELTIEGFGGNTAAILRTASAMGQSDCPHFGGMATLQRLNLMFQSEMVVDGLMLEQLRAVANGEDGIWDSGSHEGVMTLSCDTNGDKVCEAADFDTLATAVRTNNQDLVLDLDIDYSVDNRDLHFWVFDLMHTSRGDANLDRHFDSSDLVQVFQAGKYESDQDASWADGDWDGDGSFRTTDLVVALADGQYWAAEPVRAVPEPASFGLALVCLLCLVRPRR